MKNDYETVEYNGMKYIVALSIDDAPFVFDESIITMLPDKLFYKHSSGYVYCRINRNPNPVALHHIVKPYDGVSIDHINQIKTDNRAANLRYATQSEQNKNQSKRKRNVKFPEGCNIDPQSIPTFIWYMKPNGSHGDRWMVEIKEKYSWKTTSSKDISTKCKLELAKKHLRELIETQPSLFEGHCINGFLDQEGERLRREYIDILKLANLTFEDKVCHNFLGEDLTGLNESEQQLLKDGTSTETNHSVGLDFDIPEYCHYIPATQTKGDGFCVKRNQKKVWCTTRSKKKSIQEKHRQLLEYIAGLDQQNATVV